MSAAKRLALWFVVGCAGIGAALGAVMEYEHHLRVRAVQ